MGITIQQDKTRSALIQTVANAAVLDPEQMQLMDTLEKSGNYTLLIRGEDFLFTYSIAPDGSINTHVIQ